MTNLERYTAISVELAAGHPDTGVYSGVDATAVNELNAVNRANATKALDILEYMLLEKFRTNTGTDLTPLYTYGRLVMAADGVVGTDIFGSGVNTLTLDQKVSCICLLRLLGNDTSQISLDFLDSRVDNMFTDIKNAEAFGVTDKTAIQAFSANLQSRAEEIGVGYVNLGDVQNARLI